MPSFSNMVVSDSSLSESEYPRAKPIRTNNRQIRSSFRKRRDGLMKKGHELSMRGAKVAIIVQDTMSNKYTLYNSCTDNSFPPSFRDITRSYPPPVLKAPEDFTRPKLNVEWNGSPDYSTSSDTDESELQSRKALNTVQKPLNYYEPQACKVANVVDRLNDLFLTIGPLPAPPKF